MECRGVVNRADCLPGDLEEQLDAVLAFRLVCTQLFCVVLLCIVLYCVRLCCFALLCMVCCDVMHHVFMYSITS